MFTELTPDQQFRAAVYQLHERETPAALQPHHVHSGAGGVQDRGHRVEVH